MELADLVRLGRRRRRPLLTGLVGVPLLTAAGVSMLPGSSLASGPHSPIGSGADSSCVLETNT